MALTIKHLNANASFLLTFEPLSSRPVPGHNATPFHILLDPCITSPSKLFRSKSSRTTLNEPPCISSLNNLPRPNLVIISQHKSDHCSESTLRQIPTTAKTIIVAEPSAAKAIRGWKHFDRQNVLALERCEGPPRAGGVASQSAVTRIRVPAVTGGGEPGEVTVAYIPQRRDLSGLHAAIGITYRPPTTTKQAQLPPTQWRTSHTCRSGPVPFPTIPSGLATPPHTPRSHKSFPSLPAVFTEQVHTRPPPPGPPLSEAPRSCSASPTWPVLPLRPTRSASTLARSSVSHASAQRTLSVVFSPHGTVFEGNLATYATSHLVNEAALPLTALLHCSDAVSHPWWRGGGALLCAPAGKEIAVRLGAVCWVSCYDRERDARGSVAGWLRARTGLGGHEAEGALPGGIGENNRGDEGAGRHAEGRLSRTATLTGSPAASRCCGKGAGQCGGGGGGAGKETQVFTLGDGEEVVLTSEGVWNVDRPGVSGTGDAGLAARPDVDGPLGLPAEVKVNKGKKVAFHPLGEVIITGRGRR